MTGLESDIERALVVLRRGGVVACPTETQIGLLADALDAAAVGRVVDIKGRAADQPIAVLLGDAAQLSSVAAAPLSARAAELAAAHWPGPLTILVAARTGLPAPLVRDGKVGVRVVGPSPAGDLARAYGGPLTATSANRTGEPAAVTADEARALEGVDFVVDAAAPGGAPSTVIDATVDPVVVLRAGAIEV